MLRAIAGVVLVIALVSLSRTTEGRDHGPHASRGSDQADPDSNQAQSASVARAAITPHDSARSQPVAGDQATDPQGEPEPERWMVWLTMGLLGVAVLQLGAFLWQGLSLQATIRQARADSVSREHFEKQRLRAYVHIVKIRLAATAGPREILASVEIRNYGQTPAYDARVQFTFAFIDVSMPADTLPAIETADDVSRIPLGHTWGPGAMWHARMGTEVSAEEILDLRARRYAICLLGRLEYRDAFDGERATNFRVTYEWPSESNPGAFLTTEGGNDAT